MDPAIQKMQEKMDWLQSDESTFRAYLSFEKAARDEVNRINGAKWDIAQNLKNMGLPKEQIAQATGLTMDTLQRL